MSKCGIPDSQRKIRHVIGIRFIEREPQSDRVRTVFELPLPELNTGVMLFSRKEIENAIDQLDVPEINRHASKTRLGWALDVWFPNHFYEITRVPWKF